jgi:hypothetical protein
VHPRESRRTAEDAVERVAGQPAAQEDLDVLEGAVGETLRRNVDDPCPGRGLADALQVARAIAGGEDRAQGDGDGRAARASAAACAAVGAAAV